MKFKIFILLVFLGFVLLDASAQEPKEIRKANKYYNNENYCEASKYTIEAFEKVNPKSRKALERKGEMAFKTGECFRKMEDFKNATDWYQKAIIINYQKFNPEVVFYFAEMIRYLGDHKLALDNYNAYKLLAPSDSRADAGIQACKKAAEFATKKTNHLISNITVLNKEGFDMSPVFGDKKKSSVVYSSDRTSPNSGDVDPRTCGGHMDIWITQQDKKGNWGEPQLIGGDKVNTEQNEGTVCFDGKFKKMFFTRCPFEKNKNLGCDIWMSESKGKDWGEPTKVVIKTADSISIGHPCVTLDGNILIFVSDMAGGQGGMDLWYSTYSKKADLWSPPVNMGPEINSAGNELFPSFNSYEDLFFASDGHPGLGGLDIYRATKKDGKYQWESPVNIGAPRNSEGNEYSLIEINDAEGYFTSERKGNTGGNVKPDLFKYQLPPNMFDLKVIVSKLGSIDKKIGNIKVIITGSDSSKIEGVTDRKGNVFFDLKPNGERIIKENTDYLITAYKIGSEKNKSETQFTTRGLRRDQNFIIDVPLLIPEEKIRIPEVRYAFGKWELLQDSTISSKDSLNFVYDVLMKYPKLILELSSHTDSRGSDDLNLMLSNNRAKECIRYLVEEKGIDVRRLIPAGKGEKEPVKWIDERGKSILLTEKYINQFKERDLVKFEKLHALNRRTEGFVRGMDFDPDLAEQRLLQPMDDLSKAKKEKKDKKKKKKKKKDN
jgi:outer membrane protein OmpA-like peptidoglycan-associated protein